MNLALAIVIALIIGAGGSWMVMRVLKDYELRFLQTQYEIESLRKRIGELQDQVDDAASKQVYKHHSHNTSHALWDMISLFSDAKADLEAAAGKSQTAANIARTILGDPKAPYSTSSDRANDRE